MQLNDDKDSQILNDEKRINTILRGLNHRTKFCKHKHCCLMNCLRGTFESFVKAFIAKLCLNTLFTLLSLKKILKGQNKLTNLLLSLINRTNMKLGAFMAIQTFLVKGVQCLLRIIRNKEDGWNAFVSGMIGGGLSFISQDEKVKYLLRVYLAGRAIDCIYQSMILRGKINNNIWIPQLTWAFMQMIVSYAYFYEPDTLPMDTYKAYKKFSVANQNDDIWHMCNVQQFRNTLESRGIGI